MTIADRIRLRREELSLTQEELSVRCGYSTKSSITKIEKSGNNITLKKIKRVAEALGVTPSYLMGWENEIPPTVSGHTSETITTLNVDKTYDTEEVKKAMELWLNYEKADPNIRAAVETLLKPKQQDS